MIGDGQRVTVLAIVQQKLAFVIGTPELIGALSQRQSRALGASPRTAAAPLYQAVAIGYGMDRAFGRQ